MLLSIALVARRRCRPSPEPRSGQALVRLTLAGVQPLDDTVRSGKRGAVKPFPMTQEAPAWGTVEEPGQSRLAADTRCTMPLTCVFTHANTCLCQVLVRFRGDFVCLQQPISICLP
jgi:hypothetical protein